MVFVLDTKLVRILRIICIKLILNNFVLKRNWKLEKRYCITGTQNYRNSNITPKLKNNFSCEVLFIFKINFSVNRFFWITLKFLERNCNKTFYLVTEEKMWLSAVADRRLSLAVR